MFFNNNTKLTRVEREIVINQQAADMEKAGKITKNMEGRLKLAKAEPSRERESRSKSKSRTSKYLSNLFS